MLYKKSSSDDFFVGFGILPFIRGGAEALRGGGVFIFSLFFLYLTIVKFFSYDKTLQSMNFKRKTQRIAKKSHARGSDYVECFAQVF